MAKLDLLVSPPGTGKTTHCIDLFRHEVSGSGGGIDSSSYFILPSREHAGRIQNLVLKQGVPGLFNAHILSMNDLAPRLLRGSGASGPTDAIRRMILKRILETGAEGTMELGYFQAVRNFGGFHELLVDAVKEFNSNLIEVSEFERLAQPLLKDPVFRSKFRDFSVVLKNYHLALERLQLEEPEKNIERLKNSEDFLENPKLIIFDGFYHFTRAQKFLIERVSRQAAHVVVTLTLPDRPEEKEHLFEYPERTRIFLRQIGFRETKGFFQKSHRVQDAALAHLEKNIFLPEAPVFEGEPASITRLEAPGQRVEIEMIAREIRKLYRESSYHFSDICLILRSVGPYEKLIRSVFADFEIPVHVHERFQLVQNGVIQTLYRFLRLALDGWKAQDLFYLLKSSFFAARLDVEEVLAFEAMVFRENPEESKTAWEEMVSREQTPLRVQEFVRFLVEQEALFLSAENNRQLNRRLEEFLASFGHAYGAAEEVREEDTQAMQALKAILGASRRFYEGEGARVFSPQNVLAEILESIERGLFSVTPEGKNLVQVYNAVMALPKEFKVVFIAGLLEKSFPANVSEDPLFKDRERRAMNQGEIFLEERLWRVAGERYFFYMAVTRAREKLYLSYPAYDAQARPTLPSFYLSEAERCFKPGSLRVLRKTPDHFLPSASEWEARAEALAGTAETLFSTQALSASSGEKGWLFPFLNIYRGDTVLRNIIAYGLSDGQAAIRGVKAREEFARIRGVFSATRLETYQTCAFRYFASKILRLNEPVEGREAMLMGTMLHNALEAFYKTLPEDKKQGAAYLKEPRLMEEALEKLIDAEMQKGLFRNQPLYRQKIFLESMKETLRAFVSGEAELGAARGLVPTYFEIGFGKDVQGVLDYLEIENGRDPIRITGKIDRIDVSADGKEALVIDYKRSQRDYSVKKKLEKGLELQLPIYLLVARRLLGFKLLGAELRILRGSGKDGVYPEGAAALLDAKKSQIKTDGEFEAMLRGAEDEIRRIVGRLKSADIAVRSKSCTFCEMDPVCRFEKWKLVYQNE